jgi:hypothetical protein
MLHRRNSRKETNGACGLGLAKMREFGQIAGDRRLYFDEH